LKNCLDFGGHNDWHRHRFGRVLSRKQHHRAYGLGRTIGNEFQHNEAEDLELGMNGAGHVIEKYVNIGRETYNTYVVGFPE
jgi:hypothetical protein